MASTATTQTDEGTQREVLRELKWDAEVAPTEIGVAVRNGVATLTDWVETFSEKYAAERAALRVRGVKAVVNNIEVRLSPSHEQTDVDLAQSVARALEMDSLVPDDMVKVSVSGGWITLRGEVAWDLAVSGACRAGESLWTRQRRRQVVRFQRAASSVWVGALPVIAP
jgi:osmotically-inducible protein OsmY